MATIAEMQARRNAKLANELGKPPARGKVLRETPPLPPTPELPPAWEEQRSLSQTAGEAIPMAPANATTDELAWHGAMNSFDTDLVVTRRPDEPESAWLALRNYAKPQLPLIFLHRLPWALYEAPIPPTENEPF